MRKIRVLFVLLFCTVPLFAQQDEEEMFNLPIKEFTLGTVDENALLSADPQALKLYEAAVNAEKQPGVFKIPGPAVEAWQEVTKITQNNPFLQVAQKRLGEWKILTDFYAQHKANFDKLKLLFASPALPEAQKSSLASKYLEEFGVTFGTSGIVDLISTVADKNEIMGNDAFNAKIKETKQKRCDLGSGRDCYDMGKNFVTVDYEKTMMFNKACELKYQPGCDEIQPKKAEQPEAGPAPQTDKTYAFAEDPLGLLPPFAEADDATKQGADPEVLKLYEAAAALEKSKETLFKPSVAVAAWESVEKAAGKNPFQPVAQQRTADWKKAAADLEARDAALAELEKNIADNSIESSRKVELMTGYLDKYGVVFGTADALSLIAPKQNQAAESGDLYQNYAFHISETVHKEIANNESFKAKVKETVNKRCELKSGADCRVYAENHAADETEKAAYLKKTCDFGVQDSCSLQVAEVQQENKEEKKEEKDPFKEELWNAGKRTRIAVAATTLAVGVIVGGLGGWSFYEMSMAEKDRKKYYDKYKELDEYDAFGLFEGYKKKAKDARKKRDKYMILGAVGAGAGVALIATGVTLFCIEFDGEKEVKKKYNVSFGASPLNGTLQFALNW
ncbi:hypothetical protein J6Y50_04500 [bacterium]|nr:hypothetical protein [bacterium]